MSPSLQTSGSVIWCKASVAEPLDVERVRLRDASRIVAFEWRPNRSKLNRKYDIASRFDVTCVINVEEDP